MHGNASRLRVLELFAGIGGCAASLGDMADIVAAVDISRKALAVYGANLPHPVAVRSIDALGDAQFAAWSADLWWLSPPCQPFTVRGRRRDLDDERCRGLVRVVEAAATVRPRYIALENVPGFEPSRARAWVLGKLAAAGYAIRELQLCPTELGVPNRRRRYYLLAGRDRLEEWPPRGSLSGWRLAIRDMLDAVPCQGLAVAESLIQAYAGAVHVVDAENASEVSCCFTSAYGKSIASSGSFLRVGGEYRRFSPHEILRLLCFPRDFRLPDEGPPQRWWPLVGNSLSTVAVRHVLSAVPELAVLGEPSAVVARGRGPVQAARR